MNRLLFGFAIAALSTLSACAAVTRYGDPTAVETVTNEFGSTDLQMIAAAMTESLLDSEYVNGVKNKPIVTVAEVRNKTDEIIDTGAITDKIRTQLMKSRRVVFGVSYGAEMKSQTNELHRQNDWGYYKESGRAKIGQMQAAQYRIEGAISSIVKRTERVKDVYYNFNLRMIDIESGILVWSEEKEIRKTTR